MKRHVLWLVIAVLGLGAAASAGPQDPKGDAPRTARQKMLSDVKEHDIRVARIDRLRDVFTERGETDKVKQLDRMLKTENDRYRKQLRGHRDQLGDDAFRRVDRAVTDRRTRRDQRRDHKQTDRAGPRGDGTDRRGEDQRKPDQQKGGKRGTDQKGPDRAGPDRRKPDQPKGGKRGTDVPRRTDGAPKSTNKSGSGDRNRDNRQGRP